MTGISAPEAEEPQAVIPESDNTLDSEATLHNDASDSASCQQSDHKRRLSSSATSVKVEDDDPNGVPQGTENPTLELLDLTPQPSAREGESDAAISGSEPVYQVGQKRKRVPSPPWQFPTAEKSTLKTADGRRISARVNTVTPDIGEKEGRVRSVSQPDSRSRPASPPWKRFAAEGPTSIHVDGRRKSGRVNRELADSPKRISPRLKKQAEKSSKSAKVDSKVISNKSVAFSRRTGDAVDRTHTRRRRQTQDVSDEEEEHSTRIADLKRQIAALQPSRSFSSPVNESKRGHRHKRSSDASRKSLREPVSPPQSRNAKRRENPSMSPETNRTVPKLKLRLSSARHVVSPPHPQARMRSPARPPRLSLHQIIEQHELREMQQPYMENERGPPALDFFVQRAARQATEEGVMRHRLLAEGGSGGALSKEYLSLYLNERQPEPLPQYGHNDHLAAHVLHLRQLQLKEKTNHRMWAKKLAHEAVEYWKLIHGPTEEDLIAEQKKTLELMKKQVIIDMEAKWKLVEAHVREAKRAKWEAEQEKLRAEKLQQKLKWSRALLTKQRGNVGSDMDLEEDSTGDVIESNDDSDEDSDEDMDDNMTESGSEATDEENDEEGEMDENALAEYLAQRETEPPKLSVDGPYSSDEDEDDGPSDGETPTQDERFVDEVEEARDSVDHQQSASRSPKELTQNSAEDDLIPFTKTNGIEVNNLEPREGNRRQRHISALPIDEEAEAQVEEHLSSDQSTDMDSTDYDSEEDMSSTGNEDNDVEGDADGSSGEESETNDRSLMKNSLVAFYSAKDLLREKEGGLPTPVTSVENGGDNDIAKSNSEDELEEQIDINDSTHNAEQSHTQEETIQEEIIQEEIIQGEIIQEDKSHHNAVQDDNGESTLNPESMAMDLDTAMITSEDATMSTRVTPPLLLRGTLRSYQLAGLDWLVSLYQNGTNGILADEMGLGKTIQTIALLAHLAEKHEVWETHLVIVPTSVILNWVTEFQKFLPGFRVLGYYGTAEERQAKRRGWINDPHHENREKRGYNVIITSYNVAMQDINAIRAVQWHYLVLDEAHNIRNFNSQRWQVLIRLRTRARLLLTGTPLQNNLSEVWALLTFLTAGDDDRSHGELEEFLGHWKDPVKEIFDKGVQTLSAQAQKVVDQLHVSLRPFLLRRQKNEVEKDLPKKTESVVVCKLSKRQRQLYQDYMGLAEIRATLAKGSGVQAGAVLLSLRRVCNHPDLFDPRPIQTSFAMERSPLQDYSSRERLVRQLMGAKPDFPEKFHITSNEVRQKRATARSKELAAFDQLTRQIAEIEKVAVNPDSDISTLNGTRALQRLRQRQRKLQRLRSSIETTEYAVSAKPIYGTDLRELVTIHKDHPYIFATRRPTSRSLHAWPKLTHRPLRLEHPADWTLLTTTQLQQDVMTRHRYAEKLQDIIVRFAFVPPAVTAPILDLAILPSVQDRLRLSNNYPGKIDYAHEARIRTSIAFPDSRLLIYDSGKLQRLTYLLRELQAKGSRSLIFTQMTGTLNILERFLNLLNLPYLRLDGSTPVERRQLYSAEFNRPDSKFQCMILSSRAGGVGLNLTGASSVIFYDLDWNPQMDRQCMDRAHRIGQVRDVEVYKMVSEKTVEENILRRANQKSLLDQAVIQDGHFTTEFQQPRGANDESQTDKEQDEVAAAIERFLGGGEKTTTQALESVEDKEDVQAAQQARKEDHQDDIDFADRSSKGASKANTPGPGGMPMDEEVDDERKGHVDFYMIKYMEFLLKDQPYIPPPIRKLDKNGRDPGHRPKKKR